MTQTLPDFSRRLELALQARLVGDVQAVAAEMRVPVMIAGAFARDLHILYAWGVDTLRQTEDVDFGLAVPDWPTFEALRARLIERGAFRAAPGKQHCLRHAASDLPIDLVPFGGVETPSRQIVWPPNRDFVMNVLGFSEALAASLPVRLPQGVDARVISLPALATLKIMAWQDRHLQYPRRDAHDLKLVVFRYLELGNEARLWSEFAGWTEQDNFDYERSGARMLGHDIRVLLDSQGAAVITDILAGQAAGEQAGLLAYEMQPTDPGKANMLLNEVLGGLLESGKSHD